MNKLQLDNWQVDKSITMHVQVCNIHSFQKPEKSEKFKTFSNYMYFALKSKLHALHASCFSLVCIWLFKSWNIIFQLKTYLIKIICWDLYYTQYNILMFAKFGLLHCLNYLILLVWIWVVVVAQNYFNYGFVFTLASHQKLLHKNTILNPT